MKIKGYNIKKKISKKEYDLELKSMNCIKKYNLNK